MNPATFQLLIDQVARSRATVAASRDSIARSRGRIDESAQLIAKPRDFTMPSLEEASDEEMSDVVEHWDAYTQQRRIDHEVRQTTMDGLFASNADEPR